MFRTLSLTILLTIGCSLNVTARDGCDNGMAAVYPVPMFLDDALTTVSTSLLIKFTEVRHNSNISLLDSGSLQGNDRAFVEYIRALREKEYAKAYTYIIDGTFDSLESYVQLANHYVNGYDNLKSVEWIAKVCLQNSDFYIWRANVPDEPSSDRMIFGINFPLEEANNKFAINNSNYLLSLIKLVYVNNRLDPSPKITNPKRRYEYELGSTRVPEGKIQGEGVSLLFDGTIAGANLINRQEVNMLNNPSVTFYSEVYNDFRMGNYNAFIGKHTELSGKRWSSQIDEFREQYNGAWKPRMTDRYAVFLMDAYPLKILFYIDGSYGIEYGELMSSKVEPNSLKMLDFSKYRIQHAYIAANKQGDGFKITHARFTSYLDRVFDNNDLFAIKVLKPITIIPLHEVQITSCPC